jgi:hypothetical protein
MREITHEHDGHRIGRGDGKALLIAYCIFPGHRRFLSIVLSSRDYYAPDHINGQTGVIHRVMDNSSAVLDGFRLQSSDAVELMLQKAVELEVNGFLGRDHDQSGTRTACSWAKPSFQLAA